MTDRPHGRDRKKNREVGAVMRRVVHRAIMKGGGPKDIDEAVGAFVNNTCAAFWDAALQDGTEPSLN